VIIEVSSDGYEIYQALIEAGLTKEELDRKLEAKLEEFNGFISSENALSLIADNLGIKIHSKIYQKFEQEFNYDDFTIKISDLSHDSRNFVLLGKIERIFDIKNFIRKDGTPGIVGSFILNDGSSKTKIVLWDDQTKIMKSEFFKAKELVRVVGGYIKLGLKEKIEVHVSKKGRIILSPDNIDLNKFPLLNNIDFSEIEDQSVSNISELQYIKGFVKYIEGIISKIEEFQEIDKKNGEKTFLLKLQIFDDTAMISVVIWDMNAVNCLKIINEGDSVILTSVKIKYNSFTGQNEINFTKKSSLKVIKN
jgi:ssDNA-binding replication factor A large subunit